MGFLFKLQILRSNNVVTVAGAPMVHKRGNSCPNSISQKKKKTLKEIVPVRTAILLGSLNHAAEVIPFGKINSRSLQLGGRSLQTFETKKNVLVTSVPIYIGGSERDI